MSAFTGNKNFQEYTTPLKRNKSDENMLSYTKDTKIGSTAVSQKLYNNQKEHTQQFQQIKIKYQYQSQIMTEELILQQNQITNLRLKVKAFKMIQKRLKGCFNKIYMYSKKYAEGRKRMVYGITRVFRTSQHQLKFIAFQNFKKIAIAQRNQQLKHTQNIFSNIYQTGCKIFANYCKNKQRKIYQQVLFKLKMQAAANFFEKKNKMLKLYKFMLNGKKKCLSEGWKAMKLCRFNYYKKIKALQFMNVIKDNRLQNLRYGFKNLKRNMFGFKEAQIKNDKGTIQRKIMSQQSQQEVYQYKQRVQNLGKQIQQINKEKEQMNLELQNQKILVLTPLNSLRDQIQKIKEQNERILKRNEKLTQQINSPFSMDQISFFLYNNFLVFLNDNPNIPISKQELLKAIQTPLLPINVDINLIKQQNIVMKQLLSQYIVIFGAKSLKLEGINIEKSYEYIQKQNVILHNILLTLVGKLNVTKDDISQIRDSFIEMGKIVKQSDKFDNNLKEKQNLFKTQLQ